MDLSSSEESPHSHEKIIARMHHTHQTGYGSEAVKSPQKEYCPRPYLTLSRQNPLHLEQYEISQADQYQHSMVVRFYLLLGSYRGISMSKKQSIQ